MLRASLRATDPCKAGCPGEVFHTFDKPSPVKPSEVVELEVGFWPIGTTFAAREGIRLDVAGFDLRHFRIRFTQIGFEV